MAKARRTAGTRDRSGRTTVNADGSPLNDEDRFWSEVVAGGPVDDAGRSASPGDEDDLIERMYNESKSGQREALDFLDQVYGTEGGNLREARDAASYKDALQLWKLNQYADSPEMAAIAPAEYVGDVESFGATAYADPAARAAQYRTLQKLEGWTDPSITAEERFMMEVARRNQERDMRSAREGALRDLAARGARSGAAEMSAVLGGAQRTSQDRMLQDLGAQANAQKRALLATEAYGSTASDIAGQSFDERYKTGMAADDVAKFNKDLRATHDRERQNFMLEQQQKRFGRALDITDRETDANDRLFGWQRDIADYAGQGAALKSGVYTGGNTQRALEIALGQKEADKAAQSLKRRNRGLFGLDLNVGPFKL